MGFINQLITGGHHPVCECYITIFQVIIAIGKQSVFFEGYKWAIFTIYLPSDKLT